MEIILTVLIVLNFMFLISSISCLSKANTKYEEIFERLEYEKKRRQWPFED